MNQSAQMAKHFREVFFGGNWTSVNLKETLDDVSWQEAVTKIGDLNSIAVLVYHINYYVSAVLKVFEGGPLDASDKYSFDLSPLTNDEEWKAQQDWQIFPLQQNPYPVKLSILRHLSGAKDQSYIYHWHQAVRLQKL